MILQTPENRCEVLRILRSSRSGDICICQDPNGDRNSLFTLIRIRDKSISRRLLPMLIRQRENRAFEDFLGLFSQDGDLCVCFAYSDAPTLAVQLEKKHFTCRERIDIASGLFERMALLDMPFAIQNEVLNTQNITADDALRVRFNYIPGDSEEYHDSDINEIARKTEEVLKEIFAEELAVDAVPELKEFFCHLEKGGYGAYIELYREFDGIREAMLSRLTGEKAEPKTWLFRMWDKIKSLRPYVWPVLSSLVLVAAFCYLVYTLLLPPKPKGTPKLFDEIGTVEVREDYRTESQSESNTK